MIKITNSTQVETSFLETTKLQAEAQAEIAKMGVELAERARSYGVVIEIRAQSLLPPAMGYHVDVVTVYPRRAPAGKGDAA